MEGFLPVPAFGISPLLIVNLLTSRVIIVIDANVVLVQHVELPAVPPDGECGVGLNKAVQRGRRLLSGSNGVNRKAWACIDITSDENIGLCRLIGDRVSHCPLSSSQLNLGSRQQIPPENGLTYGQEEMAAGDCHGVVFIVLGREAMLVIEDPDTALEYDPADPTVLCQNFLGSPAGVDLNIFLLGLFDLLRGGGHDLSGLQTKHGDFGLPAAAGGPGHINGHISSADDDDISSDVKCLLLSDLS